MKELVLIINHLLVFSTAVLAMSYFFNSDYFAFSLVGLMIIGVFQLLTATVITLTEPVSIMLRNYWLSVLIFIISCFVISDFLLIIFPPLIALYFSYIIHLKFLKP